MLREIAEKTEVFIVTGYTDMRKGMTGLATIIQGTHSLDPYNKSLYLFCGRNARKLKGLLWEGDGFLLLQKCLDNGRFRWPRSTEEARRLSPQEIRWLLEGLEIDQPKAIKPGKRGALYCILRRPTAAGAVSSGRCAVGTAACNQSVICGLITTV